MKKEYLYTDVVGYDELTYTAWLIKCMEEEEREQKILESLIPKTDLQLDF